MATSKDRKAEFRQAVQDWIRAHGPSDWDRLLEAWPDFSRATLFRVVASLRDAGTAPPLPAPSLKRQAPEPVPRASRTDAAKAVREVSKHLPASPSPDVIAHIGQRRAAAVFDFMAYFSTIVGDANLIRDGLLKTDADGKLAVKNPVLMDKNIARRLSIIQTWLQSQELIYNYERMREMFSAVIDAVGQADPDTQKRIIEQLRELNKRRGITVESLLM